MTNLLIHDVANISNKSAKRVTRRMAFESLTAIIELADGNADHTIDGSTVIRQLADLYTFFMPPIAKPKTAEQWVAQAMAKNDVRYYLNSLYVTYRDDLVATDGYRLHIMPVLDLAHGFYDAALHPVDVDAKYPDVYPFFPIPKGGKVYDVDSLLTEATGDKSQVYIIDDGEACFDKKYIDQALAMPGSSNRELIVCGKGRGAKGYVDHGDGAMAVIMPRRL